MGAIHGGDSRVLTRVTNREAAIAKLGNSIAAIEGLLNAYGVTSDDGTILQSTNLFDILPAFVKSTIEPMKRATGSSQSSILISKAAQSKITHIGTAQTAIAENFISEYSSLLANLNQLTSHCR